MSIQENQAIPLLFLEKIKTTIEKYNMLQGQESVVVGVSGGADSVALLCCLVTLQKEFGLSVSAVHLNHNLRGEESDGDQRFVENLCRTLGVPLAVHSLPIHTLSQEAGLSMEEYARARRYELFAQSGADKIATAHSLSDRVETTVFHLVRGTGLEGLSGIPPVRGNIIRPLIDVTRQEIEDYLEVIQQPYRTDSTNLLPHHTRNFIRLEVLPLLEEINPQVERSIAQLQELVEIDTAYWEAETEEALNALLQDEGNLFLERGGRERISASYSRRKLTELPPALRNRVVRSLLRGQGLSYDRERIGGVGETIQNREETLQLSREIFLESWGDFFWFSTPPTLQPAFAVDYLLPESESAGKVEVFPGKIVELYRIDYEELENILENNPELLKNVINYDRIEYMLKFRSRLPGDKYRPYRRGGTKSLKDLFSEKGVSLGERSRTVVVEYRGEILWVEGFGAAEQVAVTPTTHKILLIRPCEFAESPKECNNKI